MPWAEPPALEVSSSGRRSGQRAGAAGGAAEGGRELFERLLAGELASPRLSTGAVAREAAGGGPGAPPCSRRRRRRGRPHSESESAM